MNLIENIEQLLKPSGKNVFGVVVGFGHDGKDESHPLRFSTRAIEIDAGIDFAPEAGTVEQWLGYNASGTVLQLVSYNAQHVVGCDDVQLLPGAPTRTFICPKADAEDLARRLVLTASTTEALRPEQISALGPIETTVSGYTARGDCRTTRSRFSLAELVTPAVAAKFGELDCDADPELAPAYLNVAIGMLGKAAYQQAQRDEKTAEQARQEAQRKRAEIVNEAIHETITAQES